MEKYFRAEVYGVYRVAVGKEELYTVLLSCKEWEDKILPIFIGENEAMSIQMALENFKPRRPLTHDLIVQMLETLGITVEKVTIDAVVGDLFTATIFLVDEFNSMKKVHIDARPSDSIAIALRVNAPIYVASHLEAHTVPGNSFRGRD